MTRRTGFVLAVVALAASATFLARSRAGDPPRHDAPPSKSGDVVVALCDGVTTAEMPGVREGETPTREQAQDVADRLMAEWRRKNPDAIWDGWLGVFLHYFRLPDQRSACTELTNRIN